MTWFYLSPEREKVGPIPEAELHNLANAGTVTPETLVWSEGMSDWASYEKAFPATPQPAILTKPPTPDLTAADMGDERVYPFQFTGKGGEYFRIWIVNVALTVLTFGVYLAWAKVRRRQYFFANTLLDQSPFQYTAKAITIFKGYLILGIPYAIGVGLIQISEGLGLTYLIIGLVILAIIGVLTPWFICKALRFKTRHTVYRNIAFGFRGTNSESYGVFMGWSILTAITFGVLAPFQQYLAKRFMLGKMRYGGTPFQAHFKGGHFYVVVLIGAAVFIGGMFVLGILALIAMAVSGGLQQIVETMQGGSTTPNPEDMEDMMSSPAVIGAVIGAYAGYIILILLATVVSQTMITNYTLSNTEVGDNIRVSSKLNIWAMLWIHVSNFAMILFSLGLATPWAEVRVAKYRLSCLSIHTYQDLGTLTTAAAEQESALGDVADDFFDFEIGW